MPSTLAVSASSWVTTTVDSAELFRGVSGVLTVIAGMLTYAAVNLALIVIVIVASGQERRWASVLQAIGPFDDAALEFATLSIGALVAWQRDPSLRGELEAGLEQEARAAFRQTIDKGKAQGMVRHAVDSDALFDIAVGAIVYGKLFSSLPARTIDIEHIVDIVVRGAEAR